MVAIWGRIAGVALAGALRFSSPRKPFRNRPLRSRSTPQKGKSAPRISFAARRPGPHVIPPPGWVPDPHWK